MSTEELINLAAVFLLSAGVCGLFSTAFPKQVFTKPLKLLNVLAVLLLFAAFALRWMHYIETMQANLLLSFPVATFYESTAFFILSLLCTLMLMSFKSWQPKVWFVADFLCATCLLGLALMKIPTQPVLFLPSLKSYWLLAHVSLSFISYGIFALAAIFGILSLIGRSPCRGYVKQIRSLLYVGIVLFSIGGIFFGALWAQTSWGRFWAWDPKETWAFITWCSYLALIHLDYRKKLSDKALSILAVTCFALVLFTFVGVNALFAGLHSYASI